MNKIVVLLLALFISGCTAANEASESQRITYKNLQPEEFNSLVVQDSVYVVDTHIPEQQHIMGTDAVIPYNEIENNLDKLPNDKSAPIALYCRSGRMGEEAAQRLVSLGYTNVYNLVGGTIAWKEKGLEFDMVKV